MIQINIIWKFFSNPVICLDGDKSGQAAAIRSAEKLFPFLQEEKSIFFLFLPDGYDPDDLLNKKGREYFGQLVKNKVSIYDFLWNYNYQTAAMGSKTPKGKRPITCTPGHWHNDHQAEPF